MAASDRIPANLEKLLFAEDFVNYVMNHHTRDKPQQCTAERYRETLYNGFNEAAKTAVRFHDDKEIPRHDIIHQYMFKDDKVKFSTYIQFAEEIKLKKFPNGFVANNFFSLCFQFALFASHCYNHGVVEAPTFAVMYIVQAMQGFDMANGGWEYLNTIAKCYAPMVIDSANKITPKNKAI